MSERTAIHNLLVTESIMCTNGYCETCYDCHQRGADALLHFIRQAQAKALRDAAHYLDTRPNGSIVKGPVEDGYSGDLGYYGEAQWLRDRADRIEDTDE